VPWPATPAATGELITAAQMNQLPIALAKIAASAASLDFTNIPSVWTHLLIVAALQQNSGSNSDDLQVRFNGDGTAKYQWQRLRGTGTTVDAAGQTNQTYINCGEVPGKSTGGFSTHYIIIPNYALAQRHEAVAYGHTSWDVASTGTQIVAVSGGLWFPTTPVAIDRVTLAPSTGTFVTGCVAMLYGMGLF
jgi:hypothetical protein